MVRRGGDAGRGGVVRALDYGGHGHAEVRRGLADGGRNAAGAADAGRAAAAAAAAAADSAATDAASREEGRLYDTNVTIESIHAGAMTLRPVVMQKPRTTFCISTINFFFCFLPSENTVKY